MEWIVLILLLLGLPLVRFALLPARAAAAFRRLPIGQVAILSALVLAGWFVLSALGGKESTGRYMRGDAEMRKLLD